MVLDKLDEYWEYCYKSSLEGINTVEALGHSEDTATKEAWQKLT